MRQADLELKTCLSLSGVDSILVCAARPVATPIAHDSVFMDDKLKVNEGWGGTAIYPRSKS